MAPSRRGITMVALAILAIINFERSLLSAIHEEHRLSFELIVDKEKKNDGGQSFHSLFPLFIGAGQGTTGTRTIHKAICALGIPSVHYNQVCFRGAGHESYSTLQHGIDAHFQARDSWMELAECVQQSRQDSQVCNKTMDLIRNIRQNVVNIVNSGIGAVHDVPYVLMTPFIAKVSKQIRGVEPIIILSERNPQEWAKRRVEKHEKSAQVVCKDTNGAFDIDYCLDSGASVDSLFHAYADYDDKNKQEEYISILVESMERYQESIRQLSPEYRINMFETDRENMKLKTIAQSIWNNNTKNKLPSGIVHELVSRQQEGGLAQEIKYKHGSVRCTDVLCRPKKTGRIHPLHISRKQKL